MIPTVIQMIQLDLFQKKNILAHESNKKDLNYKTLRNNFKIIKKLNISKNLKLLRCPCPKPNTQRVLEFQLYLNFYIANKIVLVPTYNDENDKFALKIFKKHFKNRKIIPIDCSTLIWGLGAIHCMTQQEPRQLNRLYST